MPFLEAKKFLGNSFGVALAEFAIAVPLLALVSFTTYDLSRMLIAYMELSSIVGEGVRSMSRVPGLQQGSFTKPANPDSTQQIELEALEASCRAGSASPDCGHVLAIAQIQHLIRNYSLLPGVIDLDHLEIETAYLNANDNVRVRLVANYQGLNIILSWINITVTAEGPYMF
jgi:hypothetical protein